MCNCRCKATIRGPVLQAATAKWAKCRVLNKPTMKRKIAGVFLLLIFFSACQKEADPPELSVNPSCLPEAVFTIDQTHDLLARVLALSLTDRNVRLFLHSEIGKQFTGDYDILYDLIKDREVESDKYGAVPFSELLGNVALDAGIDFSPFEKSVLNYKNLQISCPVYYGDWDPLSTLPMVVSLPEGYNEGEGIAVKAFDPAGNESLVLEVEIKNPILLVRLAERVDAAGMLRVDPEGFVIPENERSVSAAEAYAHAGERLKSASAIQEEAIIQVLDNEQFREALEARRQLYAKERREAPDPPQPIPPPYLKAGTAVTLAPPANFTVHPAGPNTIQLNWSQVTGAVAYEIFRQYMTYSNCLIATVDCNQVNYFDQYLPSGKNYTYSVRAVDAAGNRSVLTDGKESYASWRTNGRRDIIDRIYISTECWKWCCELFDGKLEFQYKTSYLIIPGNTNVTYPGSGLNSLGQRSSSQQKGKWCYYNHYLFPWDVRCSSYSYRFMLTEDDGAGNGTKLKLGITFKIQLSKIIEISIPPGIEFTIADKDEGFGEVIIQYWEGRNGTSDYSDGYDLVPDRGDARMYLKQ